MSAGCRTLSTVTYVVRSSQVLPVPAQVAFDRLPDHDSWPQWMPASFRPVGKSAGRLTGGTTFRVRILGLPCAATCKVSVARSPEELTWVGGRKGILRAEHRFLFKARGAASVEVESVESWHGVLAALLRPGIEPGATRVAREQLAALATAVAEGKDVTR